MKTKGYSTADLRRLLQEGKPTYDNAMTLRLLTTHGFVPVRTISGPSGKYNLRYWGADAKRFIQQKVEEYLAPPPPPAPEPEPTPEPEAAPLVNTPLVQRVNEMAKQLDEVHKLVKTLVEELGGVEIR